jgi:hypothetical protein
MRIAVRHLQVPVSNHFLGVLQVTPCLDQIRTEGVTQIVEVKAWKTRNLASLAPRPIEAGKMSAVDPGKNETRPLVLHTLPVANPILMLAPFQKGLPRSRHQVLCPFSAVLGPEKTNPSFSLKIEINVSPLQVKNLLSGGSVFCAKADRRTA